MGFMPLFRCIYLGVGGGGRAVVGFMPLFICIYFLEGGGGLNASF